MPLSTFANPDTVLPHPFAWYIGSTVLPSVVYGINTSLIFMTLWHFWRNREHTTGTRNLIFAGYTTLLYALVTINLITSCGQEGTLMVSLIQNIYFGSSSPAAFDVPVHYVVHISYGILTLFTDGLLVSMT